jgi:nitrogen fixation protein
MNNDTEKSLTELPSLTTKQICFEAMKLSDEFGLKVGVSRYKSLEVTQELETLTSKIIMEASNPNGAIIIAKYHDEEVGKKLKAGWRYGNDFEPLQHPELLPFTQLPKNVQAKALFFRTAVVSLAQFWAAY